jgi:hypothetical protein
LGFYKKLISKRIERIDVRILAWLLGECISVNRDMPFSQIQEFSSRRVQYVPELLLHPGPAAGFTIEVYDIDFLNPRTVRGIYDTECSTLPLREEPPKSQPESENVTDSF